MCTRQLNESFESGSNSDQNLLFYDQGHAAPIYHHTRCGARWASFEYQRLLVCIICLLKWASGWGWDTGCIDVWFINGTWVENIFNPCEIFSQDPEQTCCMWSGRFDDVQKRERGMGITNACLLTDNPKQISPNAFALQNRQPWYLFETHFGKFPDWWLWCEAATLYSIMQWLFSLHFRF